MYKRPIKKRRYGIGRKFLRGKIWWIAIYDGEGLEIRFSTKSKKESDADDLLGQKLRERSRGELVSIDSTGSALTISGLLGDYLERGKFAPGTRQTYTYQTNFLLNPAFGLLSPAKLTTDMMSDYRDRRRRSYVQQRQPDGSYKSLSRKVGETTINREIALLRAALRDLSRRRPAALPTLPYFPMESEAGNARRGFVDEDFFVKRLYPELPRHLKALAACAFYCGGRKSEWLRLDWSDVDFGAMMIRFDITKNKHPRDVPIVEGLMLDSLLETLKLRDAAWPEESAVFTYDGKRMSTVGSAWDKACKRAGCAELLFHDLRRSANRNMRDKGVSQSVRMKIMGHLTPSMDFRYGITDRSDISEAGAKLGKYGQKTRTLLSVSSKAVSK